MVGEGSSRRAFFRLAGGMAAAGWLAKPAQAAAWDEAGRIVARIKPPVFPKRDFEVTRQGAVGDGRTDCSQAIARAVAECNRSGGGRVVVPAGVFFTGPIRLKSNVNLHLAEGCTLKFSRDPKRYLPVVYTRWEGIECLNYSPLIYADGEENLAVTGGGTLDGQADCEHWWPWKARENCGWRPGVPRQDEARNALFEMGATDVPIEKRIFGEGHYLRPNLFGPCRSKNILLEGVTVKDSPMFEVSPLLCSNVTIRNVNIVGHGPNTDGCDPDSCTDVLIENCTFDTGDDCIAIKSGRNADGRRLHAPSENLIVQNCAMKDGHGGVTMGSECSGDIRNVFAQDCQMDSPNLDRVFRFKDNAIRGGVIEHAYMRNVKCGQVATAAIDVDFHYEEGEKGPFTPVVRDVEVVNLTVKKCANAWSLRGFKNAPISNIRLKNCTFENAAKPAVTENVQGLTLENVTVNGQKVSA